MQKFIELINNQFEDENLRITQDSIPSEVEGFDSLTAFSIIDSIEDEYGIQIEEKDLDKKIIDIYNRLHD